MTCFKHSMWPMWILLVWEQLDWWKPKQQLTSFSCKPGIDRLSPARWSTREREKGQPCRQEERGRTGPTGSTGGGGSKLYCTSPACCWAGASGHLTQHQQEWSHQRNSCRSDCPRCCSSHHQVLFLLFRRGSYNANVKASDLSKSSKVLSHLLVLTPLDAWMSTRLTPACFDCSRGGTHLWHITFWWLASLWHWAWCSEPHLLLMIPGIKPLAGINPPITYKEHEQCFMSFHWHHYVNIIVTSFHLVPSFPTDAFHVFFYHR